MNKPYYEMIAAGLVLFLAGSLMAQGVRMELTSSAFHEGGSIPSRYTCDGKNISPSLRWSGAPAGTKSFALIADDPDAPAGAWAHWLLWNLPASVKELDKGLPASPQLAEGTFQGKNDFGRNGYGGPCPPSGTHHYVFKLYALDTKLTLKSDASRPNVEAAMKDHILAQASLIGVYQRKP